MLPRWPAVFICALCIQAQEAPPDLLHRVAAGIADSLDRLPRYMCTQTIDRSVYQPKLPSRHHACEPDMQKRSMALTTSDRLRLDVAMTSTREMYAWAGQSSFDDRDLLDMVEEGAISTGSFTAYLTAIFRSDAAYFTYNGDVTRDGRTLSEFGYRVPREKSAYLFGHGQHRVLTGYDGTFLVDPQTTDLVRLVVRTNSLPLETAACFATSTLDYARVSLQGADFLLPSVSVLRIVEAGGEEVNRTVFSNCHAFLGESSLKFDEPSELTVPKTSPASQNVVIPPGLRFSVALTAGIDEAAAAAGDVVKAKLLTSIQAGKKVLVPAGASVAARIVGIRRFYNGASTLSLGVRLETVDVGGVPTPFTARLAAAPDVVHNFRKPKFGLQPQVELGTLSGLNQRATIVLRNCDRPCLISSGLESTWVTESAAPK